MVQVARGSVAQQSQSLRLRGGPSPFAMVAKCKAKGKKPAKQTKKQAAAKKAPALPIVTPKKRKTSLEVLIKENSKTPETPFIEDTKSDEEDTDSDGGKVDEAHKQAVKTIVKKSK